MISTNLVAIALLPSLSIQAAGEGALAIQNDAPETWVVEYPHVIAPYVDDYRRCLTAANRIITGEADFEVQSRSDVVRCAQASAEAQAEAQAILSGRPQSVEFTAADIAPTFEHIGNIHIARGADLDKQFTMKIQSAERRMADYEETKPRGLVIELRDASVVKSRTDIINNRQRNDAE